jgi:N-acetylneuraminic acid mutarotase
LTNWYSHDQRIHGELKQHAEAELRAHSAVAQMKQTSGKYSEITLVKSDSRKSPYGIKLNAREWQEAMNRLVGTFADKTVAKAPKAFGTARTASITQIQTGKISSLQEDQSRYYAVAVLNKSDSRLKLATVAWLKEPLEAWLARAESQVRGAIPMPQTSYTLPKMPEGGSCSENSWTATAAPPEARDSHTAVWTGTEMIIWGGESNNALLNSGGRYDPATDSWTFTNSSGAPTARARHTAVWTGTEMIVWGGQDESFSVVNTGGKYNPGSNSWTPTSTTNAPTGRDLHTAVWSGSEMIVWGGFDESFNDVNTGGRYNPSTNSWTATATGNAPDARHSHSAVWTGSEMIIWGGFDNFNFVDLNTGGKYNPNTNTWTATSITNVPEARENHTAIWTGNEMIVWGGFDEFNFVALNTGGRYNPNTNSWTPTSTTNVPDARENHTAVWTGNEMIVWGGSEESNFGGLNTGGRYNPNMDSWTATSTSDAPEARQLHTAVWTGSEMIVWGGTGASFFDSDLNTGGRYAAGTDSWTATNTYNVPEPRSSHTAVWTGSEMIVWGGLGQTSFSSALNDGGRYDPATDNWTATNVADAPSPRNMHTAIWTGNQMIVWGGTDGFINFNSGGRYNPGTDSWIATTSIAPYPRYLHTAVWTGTQMIIWGGDSDVGLLDTGGRYNPNADAWTATSTTNGPSARDNHSAVWTGSQMIVWGGEDANFDRLNTGGRYNPNTNNWTETSTTNTPSGREFHTAVWTGSEMIVWGGIDQNFVFPRAGGKYNPANDGWVGTTDLAPDGRASHTAIWTGTQMIVWGGYDDNSNDLNTGGQYIPGTNSWITTSNVDAPSARESHTAVWTGSETGSEMIVWGGSSNGNFLNTGGKYCAQGAPIPTPTPPSGSRGAPIARPRPTPPPRP